MKLFLSVISLLFLNHLVAQIDHNQTVNEHLGMKAANRITLGLGHTHISEGKLNGKTQWIAAASWSLNYDKWLSDKWAIGLQSDLILESFVIESHQVELIERSFPLAMVPVALYKPGKHFTYIAGVGAEFSQGHTLTMTRLGVEYGAHLPKNYEVGVAFVWDGKWKYYNSWGLAFTFSKIWPKKHN